MRLLSESCRRETEVYKSFDPAIRVVILKALCDIRVEVMLLLYVNLFAVENEFSLCFTL